MYGEVRWENKVPTIWLLTFLATYLPKIIKIGWCTSKL